MHQAFALPPVPDQIHNARHDKLNIYIKYR